MVTLNNSVHPSLCAIVAFYVMIFFIYVFFYYLFLGIPITALFSLSDYLLTFFFFFSINVSLQKEISPGRFAYHDTHQLMMFQNEYDAVLARATHLTLSQILSSIIVHRGLPLPREETLIIQEENDREILTIYRIPEASNVLDPILETYGLFCNGVN